MSVKEKGVLSRRGVFLVLGVFGFTAICYFSSFLPTPGPSMRALRAASGEIVLPADAQPVGVSDAFDRFGSKGVVTHFSLRRPLGDELPVFVNQLTALGWKVKPGSRNLNAAFDRITFCKEDLSLTLQSEVRGDLYMYYMGVLWVSDKGDYAYCRKS